MAKGRKEKEKGSRETVGIAAKRDTQLTTAMPRAVVKPKEEQKVIHIKKEQKGLEKVHKARGGRVQ